VIAPQLLKTASAATQTTLPGVQSGGFTEFALPTTDGQPFDIAAVDAATVWFTEMGGLRISRLQVSTVETSFRVLLPTVIK
jgi:streptogramin lyase